jgi:hypothetical protein
VGDAGWLVGLAVLALVGLEHDQVASGRPDADQGLQGFVLGAVGAMDDLDDNLAVVLAPRTAAWPLLLRPVAFAGVLVPLMTWVVMPRLTRLLRRWLYPR